MHTYIWQGVSMSKHCDPSDIALKSFFLGPQAENAEMVSHIFHHIVERWILWRRNRFPDDGCAISNDDQNTREYRNALKKVNTLVDELMSRFEGEVPKFSPRYIGHMFSEISLPALFGHCMTLLHNPNNVSAEASRVGIKIEHEAIVELLNMCGFDVNQSTGHFTSGGTVANFEAAIRAKWRMMRWLSIACKSKSQKFWEGTYFQAANLGWAQFHELHRRFDFSDESESELYLSSPLEAGRLIAESFGKFSEPVLLIPAHRHYSWEKIAVLLGYGKNNLIPVELDRHGTISITDLIKKLEWCRKAERPIAMLVSVLGTTELGLVDPIHEIQRVVDDYKNSKNIFIWHHIDAAFGGFFCSLKDTHGLIDDKLKADLNSVASADSFTIDPHKLGYVPYSCGAVLIRDRWQNQLPVQPTPYIDFHDDDRGHFTLEGSRSAAGATATWLTAKTIGFNADGYGRILGRTIESGRILRQALKEIVPNVHIPTSADTNILCFCVGKSGEPLTVVNERTRQIFEQFSPYKESDFYVSKTDIPIDRYSEFLKANFPDWSPNKNCSHLMLIRVCLMNPFFTSAEPKINYPHSFAESLAQFLRGRL